MSNLNVLISGCGIAGSVFASCLLRAYPNASITIVERDPELRLTGASVDIRNSAVDIIKWMNAEEAIRKQTTNEEGMQVVEPKDGRPVATLRASGRSDVQSFTSEFEIFRGALAKIFIDPIMDRVNLVFGESVDRFEQNGEKVDVIFTQSKETKSYDLFVGADGLGSKVRGTMLGTKPQEQIFDEGVRVAYFTINSDLLKGSRLAKGYNLTGGRALYLRPDPNPAGRTRGMLMIATPEGDFERKGKLDKALREGNEAYMQLMEEMYRDCGWLSSEVLEGMRSSDDFYCQLFGQVRSPKLHNGRVVLLGDAGYATPGIGTSLAIIGGYVLAGELLSQSGDVQRALQRYEEIMLPFAKSQQGGSAAMQMMNPQTAWGITIRNTIFGFVTWSRLDRLAMVMSAILGFSEKKVALPDYPWPAHQSE